MDLDEFLYENGIPLSEGQGRSASGKSLTPPRSIPSADGSSGSGIVRNSLPSSGSESSDSNKAGNSVNTSISYQRLVFLFISNEFLHLYFLFLIFISDQKPQSR